VSEHSACRLVGFSRSAAWRELNGRHDGELRRGLKALAEQYPRHGYRALPGMLRAEGYVVNPKQIYRVYREEGLQIRNQAPQEAHAATCAPCGVFKVQWALVHGLRQ